MLSCSASSACEYLAGRMRSMGGAAAPPDLAASSTSAASLL